LGGTEGGPQLIYTREQLPLMRPLRASPPDTSQPGGMAMGQEGAGAAVAGAEAGLTTSHTPTMGAGPVIVCQMLNDLLAQAT
jgi:transcription elongation factor